MSTFSPSILQGAGLFLSVLLTRGLFLFLAVLLVTRAVPWLTAGVRYALWFCVLCGFFLLPAARLLLPAVTVEGTHGHGVVSAAGTLLTAISYRETLESTIHGSGVFEGQQGAVGITGLLTWGASAMYLCGVLFCALRSFSARLVLNRLTDRARPLVEHERLFRGLARRLGIQRQVRLLVHDRVSVPFTYGTLRPLVILPAESRGWSDNRLRAVLAHEMAHIRRGDCLLNSISYALCALLWFIPLAWMARSFMRSEAEMSCDHHVLAQGFPPPRYASTLLDLAAARRNGLLAGAHGFLGCRARIEERIRRILHPVAVAPWKALFVIACLGCAVLASALSTREAEKLFGSWMKHGNVLLVGNSISSSWSSSASMEEVSRSIAAAPLLEVKVSIICQLVSLQAQLSSTYGKPGLTAIRQGGWDVVVLQENPYEPLLRRDSFFSAVTVLAAEARKKNAEAILIEPFALAPGSVVFHSEASWSGGDPQTMQARLREACRQIADRLHLRQARVGDAFEWVRMHHPEINLYENDKIHPSAAGAFLQACVIDSLLTGADPRDSRWLPPYGVTEAQAGILRAVPTLAGL